MEACDGPRSTHHMGPLGLNGVPHHRSQRAPLGFSARRVLGSVKGYSAAPKGSPGHSLRAAQSLMAPWGGGYLYMHPQPKESMGLFLGKIQTLLILINVCYVMLFMVHRSNTYYQPTEKEWQGTKYEGVGGYDKHTPE